MTVVVGYVPTSVGKAALSFAASEAQRRNESLIVLNTSRGDRVVDPRLIAEEQVEPLRESISSDVYVDVEVRRALSEREPWDELISTAESVKASVLIIGLRRRTSVGKLIMGSNAQRVLMEAPCPVIAVKED